VQFESDVGFRFIFLDGLDFCTRSVIIKCLLGLRV
jgi:hypothetical protein